MTNDSLIENQLTALMNFAREHFSDAELSQVREFIEHHEWGLALETILWMFIEADLTMSIASKGLVQSAARTLHLEDSEAVVNVLGQQ